ncbi:MAG TPA: cupin domain-containing protein [Myxococcota bacterium]|nr:cupin domain-containing protein [Myxococcota bacterium]
MSALTSLHPRVLVAAAVLCALPALAGDVLHLPKRDVDAAFARGVPLTENALYKIHASRRDAPGVGEVHVADTDIIYVLSGRATFVTGGVLREARETAPGELRGPRIEGGVERELAAGDVIIVPNGTPHWFKAVDGPVTYYVVKTTDPGAAR